MRTQECMLCVQIGGYCGHACYGAWNWYTGAETPVETREEAQERFEQNEAEEALYGHSGES